MEGNEIIKNGEAVNNVMLCGVIVYMVILLVLIYWYAERACKRTRGDVNGFKPLRKLN